MLEIEKHRVGRKSPSVLKHSLILVRSARPDTLVFIFEGIEDVGVYETWFGRAGFRSKYEPIIGRGKEQLAELHKKLLSDDPQLLRRVYFFVDCDFDPFDESEHLFVLNGYSIENFLCTTSSLDSILTDEFRCTASPVERQRVCEVFEEFMEGFYRCAEELHFQLFAARREGIKVVSKSEDSRSIADISLKRVIPAFQTVDEIVQLEHQLDAQTSISLRKEFSNLNRMRAQRGKYVVCAFRRWLRLLATDRKQPMPNLFDRPLPTLPGEPWSVSLRRLAGQSPLPDGLDVFVGAAAREA